MINIIAPNLPIAQNWASKYNYSQFIYVTDEQQIRREYRTVIINGNFSKEKKRLIEEVETHHKRVEYVNG
jgi:hypothetical protein